MNKTPLVSVVVPSYNHELFVRDSILSIVNQTYKHIEIIVIDDGSTDKSDSILRELSETYGFYYYRNRNQGLSKTLNQALAKVKGEYVAFCASDDKWMPDKIEKQLAYMLSADDNVVGCSGNVLKIDEKGVILSGKLTTLLPQKEYTFQDIFLFKYHFPAPCMFFKTDLIKRLGEIPEGCHIEDLFWLLKLTENNFKLVLLNDVLAYYRVHGRNTYTASFKMFTESLKIIGYFNTHPLYYKSKCRIANIYFPYLAIFRKQIALKYLFYAADFNAKFAVGIFFLVLPRFLVRFWVLQLVSHDNLKYSAFNYIFSGFLNNAKN